MYATLPNSAKLVLLQNWIKSKDEHWLSVQCFEHHQESIISCCTVIDENIGTPGTLPEYAAFLPEKCCSYRCFDIHVYFLALHWDNTKKQKGKNLTFYTKLRLNSPVASNRCWQYRNRNWSQLECIKVDSTLVLCACVCHTKHGEEKEEPRIVWGLKKQNCGKISTISRLQVNLQRS